LCGHRLHAATTIHAAIAAVPHRFGNATVRATVGLVRTPSEILDESLTIAVVGASRHAEKAAYAVPAQLRRYGWHIIPVNPHADEILGERCYPTLAEVPVPIDLVNVFRPSAQAADVVREAVAVGAKAVWLQQGIVSPEGRRIAEAAGLDYVEDACTAVVRAVGRLTKTPA
jgi:predicted CoA-binding protein